MIGEIKKGRRSSPFLSHKKHRGPGREAKKGGGNPVSFGRNEMMETFAESTISDLIVIADTVNKLFEFEPFRWSAPFCFFVGGNLAAIIPTALQRFDHLLKRPRKSLKISFPFTGQ